VLEPYQKGQGLEPDEPFFIYNAALYAAKRDYFLRENRLISERQVPLEMDALHSIDVDEAPDLLVAEAFLAHRAAQSKGVG
jgi:CMP-N,N'-diacetyllegionaminic acid synthase